MKKRGIITLIAIFCSLGLTTKSYFQTSPSPNEKGRVSPDVIILAENSKLGKVTFNHGNHRTKNFNTDGTGPLKCIVCHHVEQPLSEALKVPPHKTVYPADRTATLTETSLKDPKTPSVTSCGSCHIPKDAKPTILTEIPQIKSESSTDPIILTNQIAFHRRCTSCHAEVVKARPTVQAPTAMKCVACHKKA